MFRRRARRGSKAPYHRLTIAREEAILRLCGRRTGPGHVLGLDQAATSGWALYDLGACRVVASGLAHGEADQARVMARLSCVEGLDWQSTLVVLEDHGGIPARFGLPSRVLLALGEARGRWLSLLAQHGQPKRARVRVPVATWRAHAGIRPFTPRARCKALAIGFASVVSGRTVQSDDEAEAILIAHWGADVGLHEWAAKIHARSELAKARRKKTA